MSDRFYSEEEAQEILRLATRRAASEGGMTRDKLIQAAAEMGIDAADIVAAEREVAAKQVKVTLRQRFVEKRARQFYGSVSQLVGMSALLFGINFVTMGGFHSLWTTWAIWPCGFFALHAFGEGWEYLVSGTKMGDEAFEKWCLKQEEKGTLNEWSQLHPGTQNVEAAARRAYAHYGSHAKLNAIKELRDSTGLPLREAKDLIDRLEREQMMGQQVQSVPPLADSAIYEAARQAVQEVGPGRKFDAVDLVRARTGLSPERAREAVEAVLELTH